MVQLVAFRRSLVALALCTAAIAASATPASARSHHGAWRHAHARHIGHHIRRHYGHRHYRHYRHIARHMVRMSRWDAGVAHMRARGLAGVNASFAPGVAPISMTTSGGFGSSSVVAEARRYLGGNPTGRGSLWCARFMNLVLQHSGYRGTGSDMARRWP